MLAAPPNARIQASVPSYSIYPFYNRVTELDYFKEKFSGEVGLITVLVGPRNCGKSRLLENLSQQYEAQQIGPLFLIIDARFTPVCTPDEVSKALLNALETRKIQKLMSYVSTSLPLLSSISINAGLVTISLGGLFTKLSGREVKLEEAINKFDKLLEAVGALSVKPVIIIDEANKLMSWKEPDPLQPELQRLLDFLIGISKQKRLAHVILATSDYFLANWLTQAGMTEDKFEVEVLGDLTEEEAEKFMYGDGVAVGGWRGIVNDPFNTKEVLAEAQDQWSEIYQRCGGNIGLLKQCVAAARNLKGNWDSALQKVVAGPLGAVIRGFEPEVYIKKGGEAPLWTDAQWRMVLERITTAPHHAVLASELKEELGKGSEKKGSEILLSMVKYNLLALRPPSTLARDLPQEVYGSGKKKTTVVTLPLPAHVWAAEVVLEELKDKEKAKDSNPQL
ncbi:hypothetical protein KSW81_005963 [Nannochloris sp. 'desiccata']|nr:hypothetical protein KSW81_005963 [Chlorella desiccata (nom. nud.)]